MNKIFKTTVCLTLAAILLLTSLAACRNNDGGGETMALSIVGRYVETDITPPIDGPFLSFLTHDGTIVAFDNMLLSKYTSTDGGDTWTGAPGPMYGTEEFLMIREAALLPDGRLLAFMFNRGLVKISPDGSTTPFPVARIDSALAEGEGVHVNISLIQLLGNDRVLISYSIMEMMQMQFGPPPEDENDDANENENENDNENDATQRMTVGMGGGRMDAHTALYDLSGTLIADLPIEGVTAAAAGSESFYVLDSREERVYSFNINTGAPAGQTPVSLAATGGMGMGGFRMVGMGGNILALNNYGELLAVYNNALLHMQNGDIHTVLDGNSFSFGEPNSNVNTVMGLADGSIVIGVLTGANTGRLYRYAWDENAVINPARTLVVWSLTNNDFVRATITELRRRHPDAYITYEVALSGMGMSASDAIRVLNTRLLSGRGPDVLILDGTPVENYVGRGMLLDLSRVLNTSDMYQNLLAPYTGPGGEIYALPMQLRIPALAGYAEVLAAVQSLDALVSRVVAGNRITPQETAMFLPGNRSGLPEEERTELHFRTLRELFDFMWLANASAVVYDNQLDSAALGQFFNAIRAISDMYGLAMPDPMGGMMGMVAMFGGAGRPVMVPASLMQFISYSTNMAAFNVENIMILNMLNNRENAELINFPGMVPGVWLPSTIVGVSADTEVPEFAKEFVNAMLSLDVQRINYGEGLPVTRAGMAAQVQEINDRQAQMDQDPLSVDMDALVARLQTPAVIEMTLIDIIWETAERLCTGAIDLEGAVREVEQNIRNYLAERS